MTKAGPWEWAKRGVKTRGGRLLFVLLFLGSLWLLFPNLFPKRVVLQTVVDEHRCAERIYLEVREAEGGSTPAQTMASVAASLSGQSNARLDRRLPRGAYVVDIRLECPDGTTSAPVMRPLSIDGDIEVQYHVRDRCACSAPGSLPS